MSNKTTQSQQSATNSQQLNNIQIIKLSDSKKDRKRFIDFPHELYKGDPNYVPELYQTQEELVNPKKNPFFKHSKADLFLAIRDNKIVGRIAAIRNNNYNEYIDTNVGFFGFFDVIDDYHVAEMLLDKAVNWAKNEKLDGILGPTNFTTNDTAGLLVNGFEAPPVIMMTYNKPYYVDFIEKYGFTKKTDLLAYAVRKEEVAMKSVRIAKMIEERLKGKGITVRTVNMKKFNTETRNVLNVYKAAWDKNWGFVPPTDEEFLHMAASLKMFIQTEFSLVAEQNGKMVGFALAVPNINEISINFKKGRLFPFNIFKLLLNKKKTKMVRILTLGVVEGYRKLGIEAIFYARIISEGIRLGFDGAEASWILEDNEMMNQALIRMNADPYKRYRIYQLTF